MEVCRGGEFSGDHRKYGHLQYLNAPRPGTNATTRHRPKNSYAAPIHYLSTKSQHSQGGFLSPNYRRSTSPYLDGTNHESTGKLCRPKRRYNKEELLEFMK
jgi:hypothetical protein